MQIDRRIFLGGLSAALVAPGRARAAKRDRQRRPRRAGAGASDARISGRPARRHHALHGRARSPDRLAARQPRRRARIPRSEKIGARPEVGRITGRGNTANLEVVLALKPDLILDIGIVNNTYISLADRVQQQTGIPYALLDGRFDGIPDTYRTIGALTGRRDAGEAAARYAERNRQDDHEPAAAEPRNGRASTTRAGRAASRPGSAARSMWRRSSCSRATSRAARAAASPPCRSRTCWCGIPR